MQAQHRTVWSQAPKIHCLNRIWHRDSQQSSSPAHPQGSSAHPASRFTHLREEDGRQTVLPSFFSKFSRKKPPYKTHLSPVIPLSNSTFCEMGVSFMRCTENGHIHPDCHLRPPLSAKPVTTLLWYSLVQPEGSAHQQKNKALAFYTISLLKHCLASCKLFSKSFNHLTNLLPLKYLCSMLPSRVNLQGRQWRNRTKRAVGTETHPLRSREHRAPRRPFRSAPLLTPPSAPQPLPPLPALIQAFSPSFFLTFFCKASATRPRKGRTKEAGSGYSPRTDRPSGGGTCSQRARPPPPSRWLAVRQQRRRHGWKPPIRAAGGAEGMSRRRRSAPWGGPVAQRSSCSWEPGVWPWWGAAHQLVSSRWRIVRMLFFSILYLFGGIVSFRSKVSVPSWGIAVLYLT